MRLHNLYIYRFFFVEKKTKFCNNIRENNNRNCFLPVSVVDHGTPGRHGVALLDLHVLLNGVEHLGLLRVHLANKLPLTSVSHSPSRYNLALNNLIYYYLDLTPDFHVLNKL